MSTLALIALGGVLFFVGALVGFFLAAIRFVGRDEYEDMERPK